MGAEGLGECFGFLVLVFLFVCLGWGLGGVLFGWGFFCVFSFGLFLFRSRGTSKLGCGFGLFYYQVY